MKTFMQFALFAMFFSLTFISCKKDDKVIANTPLTGKWEFTSYFMSPGAGGAWYPVDNTNKHTLRFGNDGSFKCSNNAAYYSANRYEIVDSIHVRLISPSQPTLDIVYFYSLEDNNTSLLLSPYRPAMCIEGCSSKYKAISSGNN